MKEDGGFGFAATLTGGLIGFGSSGSVVSGVVEEVLFEASSLDEFVDVARTGLWCLPVGGFLF